MKIDKTIKEELVGYLKTHDVKNKSQVIKKYVERRLKDKKKDVTIISSYKLSDQEITEIKDRFPFIEKKGGEVRNKVNTDLMAGLIIKFGSKVLDLTLESQLSNLERDLKSI